MQFSYNVLNLPETVTKSDGSCSLTYTYLSDGTKVRARIDREFGSAYKGGFIYTVTPGGGLGIESVAWDEGRIIIGSDGSVAQDQWYVRDHLGNVRSVIDLKETTVAAAVKEQSDYLPFGTRVDMTNQGSGASDNRWRYAGKEEQRFGSGLFGIDLAKIDFGARFYDPYTARWTTIDPLASKYPAVSPYTYCANDPVNRLDPDGNKIYDSNGNIVTYNSKKGWSSNASSKLIEVASFMLKYHTGSDRILLMICFQVRKSLRLLLLTPHSLRIAAKWEKTL